MRQSTFRPTAKTPDANKDVEATARLFRALGDPTRLAIVSLLAERAMTVGELVEALGVSQSRVSNHLACLKWCRLVESTRQGKYVRYQIADPRTRELVSRGRQVAANHADYLASCKRIGPEWV